MSAKTKIVVVKAKELIYTALFVCLGIILILLLIFMFAPEEKSTKTSAGVYTPGVYTSTIALGDNTLDVAVSVDADHITSVSLNHLSDSVSAMYPLLEPSLEEINAQLENISSIDDLKLNSENKYTGLILQQAIKNALSKAKSRQSSILKRKNFTAPAYPLTRPIRSSRLLNLHHSAFANLLSVKPQSNQPLGHPGGRIS